MKQSSENYSDGVHAEMGHPPYNTRWIAKFSNWDHDHLDLEKMSHYVKLVFVIVEPGCAVVHVLLCTMVQHIA